MIAASKKLILAASGITVRRDVLKPFSTASVMIDKTQCENNQSAFGRIATKASLGGGC